MSVVDRRADAARQAYRDEAARAKRDAHVERHLPLVKRILRRVAAGLPTSVDMESLESAGVLGLLQAAQQYDEKHEVDFEKFAARRIEGEIIDELRRNSPLSQRVLTHLRLVRRAMDQLGTKASAEELAEHTQLTVKEVDEALAATNVANIWHSEDMDVLMFGVFDWHDYRPELPVERAELVEALTTALMSMEEKDRLVITLYYFEELTLQEIAKLIDMTESGVSRLRKRLIGELGAKVRQLI